MVLVIFESNYNFSKKKMAANNNDTYYPQFIFRNKHFNTAYRTLFQRLEVNYERKRVKTRDDDFLDLDFSYGNSETVAHVRRFVLAGWRRLGVAQIERRPAVEQPAQQRPTGERLATGVLGIGTHSPPIP